MRILQATWFNGDWAFALLAAGLLLVYLELCRPGTVVAGALGGALILLVAARISVLPMCWEGLLLIALGMGLWLMEAWFRWPGLPGFAGAVLFAWGGVQFLRSRWSVALPLALILGAATVILGSAAIRGYLAKQR